MIKYLGSKRRLVPVLGELLDRAGAATALDLFTGTTRVAQEWKRRGAHVTAVDSARYAAVLAECYIEVDAREVDLVALGGVISHLQAGRGVDPVRGLDQGREQQWLPGVAGPIRLDGVTNGVDAAGVGDLEVPGPPAERLGDIPVRSRQRLQM